MSDRVTLPEGWLTGPEADELRRLAAGKTVLELGAWKGRSTVALASTATYVISVDRHHGIPEVGGDDSLPDYLAAVRGIENVAIVVASFADFTPLLSKVGLVYIDGDHDALSAARDTNLALEVRPDVIAYHDWDFVSVREGATEALGLNSNFASYPTALVGSVASFARVVL